MSAELIFEDPPTAGRGGGYAIGSSPIGQWLEALKKHPGKWAKYPERKSATIATQIKEGRYYGALPGEFEVATRNNSGTPKRCDLYARYVAAQAS